MWWRDPPRLNSTDVASVQPEHREALQMAVVVVRQAGPARLRLPVLMYPESGPVCGPRTMTPYPEVFGGVWWTPVVDSGGVGGVVVVGDGEGMMMVVGGESITGRED
ncbi:hypothetical protein L1987_01773 [Smallanthus sonchifolius]|uniref:Uncharacterized protein n=1 Tax=Smallanthus sonchifolius TaxID=185202 RepID=A0ACB9K674_9ASTR|nr:hypothetical protein L1987_01773 [Smallanthus sonchifolius]